MARRAHRTTKRMAPGAVRCNESNGARCNVRGCCSRKIMPTCVRAPYRGLAPPSSTRETERAPHFGGTSGGGGKALNWTHTGFWLQTSSPVSALYRLNSMQVGAWQCPWMTTGLKSFPPVICPTVHVPFIVCTCHKPCNLNVDGGQFGFVWFTTRTPRRTHAAHPHAGRSTSQHVWGSRTHREQSQ